MKNIHLTLDDRLEIEAGLKSQNSLSTISKSLNKEYNTIKNEIINKREKIYPSNFNGNRNLCLHYQNKTCAITNLCNITDCNKQCMKCFRHFCNTLCSNYIEYTCDLVLKSPFCCNNCTKRKSCQNIKYIYSAKSAQQNYEKTLSLSRKGARITNNQLEYLNSVVKNKIKKGQSVDVIVHTDSNLKCSTSSLYRYIDEGITDIKNIDLRKKVSMAPRKKKNNSSIKCENSKIENLKKGRNYQSFIEKVNKFPNYNIAEMDTVIGKIDNNQVLLTLLFRKSNFMMAFILDSKTSNAVENKLKYLKNLIGFDLFTELFKILLTDNGTEFTLIEEIEKIDEKNKINLYFCDAGKSNQKGKIEKNHVELRKVLPKGYDFDKLNQKMINEILSNINSYPRKILKYKTPYDVLKDELKEEKFNYLLEKLDYHIVNNNDLTITPELLKSIK